MNAVAHTLLLLCFSTIPQLPPPLPLPTNDTTVVAWQAAPAALQLPSLPEAKLNWWQRWARARSDGQRQREAAAVRPPPLPDLPRAASLSKPKSMDFPVGRLAGSDPAAGASALVVRSPPRHWKAVTPGEGAVAAGNAWAPMTVEVLE